VAAACGGGGSPSGPTTVPGTPVSGSVFYDENGNGVLDAPEAVRLPGVTVAIGGKTAASATGGRFTVSDVPSGPQEATISAGTLPAYFTAGPAVSLTAPASGEVALPAVLAIAAPMRKNVYLAFGDSISAGVGSTGSMGYRDFLAADLRAYWGRADVLNGGRSGTKTDVGEAKIWDDVAYYKPAYVLILYGTNDWNYAPCRNDFPCYTIDNLRSMVQQARAGGALPIVGTIPPVNPNYADRQAEDRNDWVRRMNALVKAMAAQERAPVADVHTAFLNQQSLPPLFADFLHPNDEGYRVMSRAFFDAITKPLAGSAQAAGLPLLLDRP
jgi:lysophospholipase L1-like esterase